MSKSRPEIVFRKGLSFGTAIAAQKVDEGFFLMPSDYNKLLSKDNTVFVGGFRADMTCPKAPDHDPWPTLNIGPDRAAPSTVRVFVKYQY